MATLVVDLIAAEIEDLEDEIVPEVVGDPVGPEVSDAMFPQMKLQQGRILTQHFGHVDRRLFLQRKQPRVVQIDGWIDI